MRGKEEDREYDKKYKLQKKEYMHETGLIDGYVG